MLRVLASRPDLSKLARLLVDRVLNRRTLLDPLLERERRAESRDPAADDGDTQWLQSSVRHDA